MGQESPNFYIKISQTGIALLSASVVMWSILAFSVFLSVTNADVSPYFFCADMNPQQHVSIEQVTKKNSKIVQNCVFLIS